jgi:cell wall assembly regulator SMI1
MPHHFLPFSNDGRGNHYCLDLSRLTGQSCPVVFWQWNYDYASLEEVEACNDNFVSWVKEVMIDWTLEMYNYDGSKK